MERLPRVAYFGASLSSDADLDELGILHAEGLTPSTADIPPGLALVPVSGGGFLGAPALALGGAPKCRLVPNDVQRGPDSLRIELFDPALGVTVVQVWQASDGVFRVSTVVTNDGAAALGLHWLAALTLPLPTWARTHWSFAGRWAGEFRATRSELGDGVHEQVSRGGRPGFQSAGFALIGDGSEDDFNGRLIAFHLAWSGDSRLLIERTGFGLGQLQIGERLEPGEIVLKPGCAYASPEALLCRSERGFDGVRQRFRGEAERVRPAERSPRRVHFNTWEAAYFDFDLARLQHLASAAARLGAERFVLDDGWFKGRRNDKMGLGDWTPDAERFPEGLAPLIAHVESLGMDFGLWVEPEMVNPDSDLYRAHPDWVLRDGPAERPLQRGQLVLDLTRRAVSDHIFAQLDALLRENRISYLKWDHNRELFPALSEGEPAGRRQAHALYDLMERLHAAHPGVEIESCASGGGRIDFGVLRHASRFWASDNTDAIERLRIQSDLSLFLPLHRIGSHVGASPNPSTGRRLAMLFRARVAMFAHMGLEADPTKLSEDEAEVLASHIALYKAHRELIHGGVFHSYHGDDRGVRIWLCVAQDKSEALGLAARIDQAPGLISPPLRLNGLDADVSYSVDIIRPWPEPARHFLAGAGDWRSPRIIGGEMLVKAGLRLPLVHPETAWLFHLKRVSTVKT
jgi:alpha-galactosidase